MPAIQTLSCTPPSRVSSTLRSEIALLVRCHEQELKVLSHKNYALRHYNS